MFKKGQQETVGFVLIIIIVSVIALIALWFLFRAGDSEMRTSVEVSNLLEASMHYTTECAIVAVPEYEEGKELIKSCYKNPNEKCLDGKDVCKALNETFKTIIGKSLDVGEDSPNKAYKLRFYYHVSDSDIPDKEFLKIEEGRFMNCSERYGGISYVSEGSGNIEVKLEVCKGK